MSMIRRFLAIPFSIRLAVTLWVILLVGVGVRVALSKPTSQSVVPIYRQAGMNWLAERDLYTYQPGLDVYRNPPIFADAFTLVNVLPEKTGALLWRGVSVVVLLAGLAVFLRTTASQLTPRQQAWAFCAAVPLALISLNNGQVNVLLTGSVLLAGAAFARNRYAATAICITLAIWLKLYPISLGLLLVLLAPRALAWRFSLGILIGGLIPFLFTSPEYVLAMYKSYAQYLQHEDRTYSFLSQVQRDWTIIPRQWLGLIPPPEVTRGVSLLVAAMCAGLVLTCCRGMERPRAAQVAVGLACIWMTLFGPATEIPTYTLIIPVLCVAVVSWQGWRRILAMFAMVLVVATVCRGIFPSSEVLPLRTAFPFATGFLLIGLVGELFPGNRRVKPSLTLPGMHSMPRAASA